LWFVSGNKLDKTIDMNEKTLAQHYKPAILAGGAAITISLILTLCKAGAWLVTGSAVIMASLVDSLSDLAISAINFFAIRQAMKPADADHRYGHGKVEGLAALMQAAFLSAAAFFILLEAMQRLVQPQEVTDHLIGFAVMALSATLTLVLLLIQTRSLKKTRSLAVEADRTHYAGDFFSHFGVIIILAVDYFGGPAWVDPLGAIGITFYLALCAWGVGKKGTDMLLDREAPGDIREKIITTVLAHEGIHGMHDLRTRQYGMKLHIAFDVEIKPDLLLCEAHAISKEIEEELLGLYPHAEIMIHKDPIGDTDDSRHQVKGVHHE
jgi:ferrous-iron efflux pump FieF